MPNFKGFESPDDDAIKEKAFDFFSHLPPIPAKPPQTLFEHFIGRMRSLFVKGEKPPLELSGRLKELTPDFERNIVEINQWIEEVQANSSMSLHALVSLVLLPLISEAKTIRLNSQGSHSAAKVKFILKMSSWVDKSSAWLRWKATLTRDELLLQAREAVVHEVHKCIDKDIRLIKDYTDQSIRDLSLTDHEKVSFCRELAFNLRPYVYRLDRLKFSAPRQFETLQSWKISVDDQRQHFFEKALTVVESLVENLSPSTYSPEEHHHLLEILNQLSMLETKLPHLTEEIEKSAYLSKHREVLLERLAYLEEEAHRLNLDLRLPDNVLKRLQSIGETLKEAKNILYRDE